MKVVVILFTLFTMASCGDDKVPADIIEPTKMENVLWDMLRAEEMAQLQFIKDSTIAAFHRHSAAYDRVFKEHDITKEEFQQSFKFYQGRPDLLKPIFESLHARSEKIISDPNSN